MTIGEYWNTREQELKRELDLAEANLEGRDHRAEVKALSNELRTKLPKLFRKAVRKAQVRIVLKRKAGSHSFKAARFLGNHLLKNGQMRLMMYGRPSGRPDFPMRMWLLPGEENWYGVCDFNGLNEERIRRSHPMLMVSCDEGVAGKDRTLYTVYPARDGFPLEWQLHFSYNFDYQGRTYSMGDIFPTAFTEISKELNSHLARYQELAIAQQETQRRIDRRARAAMQLQDLARQRECVEEGVSV